MLLVSCLFIAWLPRSCLAADCQLVRRRRRDLGDAVMDLTRLAVDAGQFINRAVQVIIIIIIKETIMCFSWALISTLNQRLPLLKEKCAVKQFVNQCYPEIRSSTLERV